MVLFRIRRTKPRIFVLSINRTKDVIGSPEVEGGVAYRKLKGAWLTSPRANAGSSGSVEEGGGGGGAEGRGGGGGLSS